MVARVSGKLVLALLRVDLGLFQGHAGQATA